MAIKTCTALINGVTYPLTFNQTSKKWEINATAPNSSSYNNNSAHYYGVIITAVDDAGNQTQITTSSPNFGESLKLFVKEKVKPVINIISPGENAFVTNNNPTIEIDINDNDSGIDISTFSLVIGSSAALSSQSPGMVVTNIGNGKKIKYTPTSGSALSEGLKQIKVNVKDFDLNLAVEKTRSFTIDTVPPNLNITAPSNNLLTNIPECNIIGTTNDLTSSPVILKYILNSGLEVNIPVNPNGTFNTSLILKEGMNSISVIATDSAGKTSSVTKNVILDTVCPEFTAVSISPNHLDAGGTYNITVQFNES